MPNSFNNCSNLNYNIKHILPDKAIALEKAYFSKAMLSSFEFSFNIIRPLTREVEFLRKQTNKQTNNSVCNNYMVVESGQFKLSICILLNYN